MTDNENEALYTIKVPNWLKHCFDDVYDTDAADYKKLAAVMKDKSFLHMAVADLSDETLDCAATVYCDDWYYLEPEQQQELRENIQDWIGALLVAGAISVLPQSNAEKPFWKPIEECPKEDRKMYFIMMNDGFAFSGWYNRENKQWEGDAECYKKARSLTTRKFHHWRLICSNWNEVSAVVTSNFLKIQSIKKKWIGTRMTMSGFMEVVMSTKMNISIETI